MEDEFGATLGLLESLPLAVVVVADGMVLAWNPAAEILYGHPAAEAVDRRFTDLLCDPADAGAAEGILATAASGGVWEGDFRIQRRDGALLVTSFRATSILVPPARQAVLWVGTDRMDQRRAEEERAVLLSAEHAARTTAEEALALLEAVLAAAPVGIAVFDLDLRFVRVNAALAAINGVQPDDHLGRRIDDVVSMPADVTADLRRVLATGRTLLGREVTGETPAEPGARRHFVLNYYPVLTAGGVIAGAGVTVSEVTQAKRAAVERAELLARAEAAQHRLAVLVTASTVLTSTMEVAELLDRLARVLAPGVGDLCVLELVDPTGAVGHVAVSEQDRGSGRDLAETLGGSRIDLNSTGVVAEVIRTGRPRMLRGRELERFGAAGRLDLRSAIVAPVEVRNQVFGVLCLATTGTRELNDEDVDLVVEVAHRAALAVRNAQAFAQERQVAETLQRALLPAEVPAVPGLEIAVRYLAATAGVEVGGDWYDVVPFPSGQTGLVIGDVVGHDVRAASAMGQLRNALRAYVMVDDADPGATLVRVDRLVNHLDLTLATCILMIIDAEAGTATWSNAGHPPPLLVRGDDVSFLDDGHHVILGAGGRERGAPGRLQLIDADTLILYTDGLIERRTESLGTGFERLAKAARSSPELTAGDLCDHLIAELVPTEQERDDDIAILVARYQSPRLSPA
jgi:PAS domain S-box-containing protein